MRTSEVDNQNTFAERVFVPQHPIEGSEFMNANVNRNVIIGMLVASMSCGVAYAQCGATKARAVQHKADIVQTAQDAGQFNTLLAAAKAAGLVGALQSDGPLTVFAPTDDAFAKLPEGTIAKLLKPENKAQLQAILKYHVVSGKLYAKDVMSSPGAATLNGQRLEFSKSAKGVMIDGARVVKADIKTSNGIIHVIDSVVLPSSSNIVETAKSAETFNTLLAAAMQAGLADTLSNGGPYTVFAPTDEAFGKLPDGTVASLLEPVNRDKLANILKYHVVAGRVYSADALKAGKAETLNGKEIRIAMAGGQARVNDARLIKTDLDASNGVIHVIDEVIIPQ